MKFVVCMSKAVGSYSERLCGGNYFPQIHFQQSYHISTTSTSTGKLVRATLDVWLKKINGEDIPRLTKIRGTGLYRKNERLAGRSYSSSSIAFESKATQILCIALLSFTFKCNF